MVDDLHAMHRTLLTGERQFTVGAARDVQNWIGTSPYNPCAADFVPPPPEMVDDLLDDLVAYVNGDDHPPLVQAAVSHAQFETIHPYADGNGRVGRALIHMVLTRRGLTSGAVLPEVGALTESTGGRRNRVFEARDLLELVTSAERRLVSPGADTQASPPVRRVPHRPS